jgi:BirA family biotin operon repressor/biotin-[acetyl-CoA-carboxylase] ligase
MSWARARVLEGSAAPGAVFVAAAQSRGRGRHGRSWLSLPGKGLYMTVVLPDAFAAPAVTLAAALALVEAAMELSDLTPRIKWPNDLFLGDKKWGGTLAEVLTLPAGNLVLLGLGANLNHEERDFPEDLARVATSLAMTLGRPLDAEAFLSAVLRRLEVTLGDFQQNGFAALAGAYRRRSAFQPGDRVEIQLANEEPRSATYRGIDREGRLVLEGWPQPVSSATVLTLRAGQPTSSGRSGPG